MDKFSDYPTSLTAPARDGQAITPQDTVDLPFMSRAIYVGRAGNLSLRMAGGQTLVFQNVPDGSILPFRARGVNATGTTATGLVALW